MPSIGPLSPGTMADDASVGTVAWINPDNAKVSDNVYTTFTVATASGNIFSHYLVATNFGFSIPSDATIDGVVVEYEVKSDGQTIIMLETHLVIANVVNPSNQGDSTSWPASETYLSRGGATDKFGGTLPTLPSDINDSGFGVAFKALRVDARRPPNTDVGYIDHIRLTVYYTGPRSPLPTFLP